MTKQEFRNLMSSMMFLDKDDLGNPDWWRYFQIDPHTYFIRCSDERSDLIWNALVNKELTYREAGVKAMQKSHSWKEKP